jgi:hypothetical protein
MEHLAGELECKKSPIGLALATTCFEHVTRWHFSLIFMANGMVIRKYSCLNSTRPSRRMMALMIAAF